MRAAIGGDETAYGFLLRRLPSVLRGVFRSTFNKYQISQSDQEDIIQDVLIVLHVRRAQWDPKLPLLPWVFAITHNKIIDEVRKRSRRRDMDVLLQASEEDYEDLQKVDAAHDADRLLASHPPRSRRIVASISIEGYSARELASQLDISEVAVRIALHRGLKTLAEAFGVGLAHAKAG
jgi:RNA polymerase sigma-70 factor (ECF subfamily)